MLNGIDFRIVAVILSQNVNGSPSWVVITNDGFPTVYTSWGRVPQMVRNWLNEHNDYAHSINGTVIVDKVP